MKVPKKLIWDERVVFDENGGVMFCMGQMEFEGGAGLPRDEGLEDFQEMLNKVLEFWRKSHESKIKRFGRVVAFSIRNAYVPNDGDEIDLFFGKSEAIVKVFNERHGGVLRARITGHDLTSMVLIDKSGCPGEFERDEDGKLKPVLLDADELRPELHKIALEVMDSERRLREKGDLP